MIRRLYNTISSKLHRKETEDPILKGILNGSLAFTGPLTVQFDITNRCNNNCICCWNNSPLLGEISERENRRRKDELPLDLIKRILTELNEMGTKNLFFAGGGEPFMHPDIMEILRFAKGCKMKIFINTNFTLIDEKMAKEFVDMKIDMIHVSLLAGSAKTYAAVHPGKKEETFYRIKEVLQYLISYRKRKQQGSLIPFPHIDLYYVIFNRNYQDINNMIELGMELKANTIEFMPIDIIPGKTDVLLLNEMEKKEVLRDVLSGRQKLDEFNRQQAGIVTFIEQYLPFIERLSAKSALRGEYETNTITGRPCYVGWAFARILADGSVNPCLKAHRISVGNVYKQSFKEIWNGKKEQLFRDKSFKLDKNDKFFTVIGNNPNARFGCLTSCDNIQINTEMHDKYGNILKENGKIK
ncbi:radical SAM protein [bacterium]|nr:MAG: radical SAM protein [bacterium]